MNTEGSNNQSGPGKNQFSYKYVPPEKTFFDVQLNIENIKTFFRFTGGSLFYCISAVFITFGIVNLMGPILSEGDTLIKALPCIITLHVYELSLLAVLILIVSRKVVDDAISLMVFIALFLIGTSIAIGTVVDKNISLSFGVAIIGIGLGIGKIFALKRFINIKYQAFSFVGSAIVIIYNYLGPVFMAKSIASDPAQESIRRNFWLILSLIMLLGALLILFEAIKRKSLSPNLSNGQIPFLQKPAMTYIFSLILIIASAVHQYAMAYTFTLERAIGDYVPASLIAALLLIEILRLSGKKFGFIYLGISFIPLAMTLLAIQQKSVPVSGHFNIELIVYPPVILALSGLAIVALALYHRWYLLIYVAALYGSGVVLTAGYSPAYPYDLNMYACGGLLVGGLLIYGILIRNQYLCFSAIVIICLGLYKWAGLANFSSSHQMTQAGSLAGVCGFSFIIFYLFFGHNLNPIARIIGLICLIGFTFDYMPEYIHWKYIVMPLLTGFIATGIWLRTKDLIVISVLWTPYIIRIYLLAKQIEHWRYVILGFFLLLIGTIVSLLKRPEKKVISSHETNNVPQ